MLKLVQIVQGLAALQVDRPSEILISRSEFFFPKVVAERYLEKQKDSPAKHLASRRRQSSRVAQPLRQLLIKCLVKHLI